MQTDTAAERSASITRDPRQAAYAAARAEWCRVVWPALGRT